MRYFSLKEFDNRPLGADINPFLNFTVNELYSEVSAGIILFEDGLSSSRSVVAGGVGVKLIYSFFLLTIVDIVLNGVDSCVKHVPI
jgi:hypothetical protein